jgi:hypothetical protein
MVTAKRQWSTIYWNIGANYKEPRKKSREAVGTGKMKVGILLGDPTEIKHTMACVKATGRLSN